MERNRLRHLSELALIRAIPDLTIGDLKPMEFMPYRGRLSFFNVQGVKI